MDDQSDDGEEEKEFVKFVRDKRRAELSGGNISDDKGESEKISDDEGELENSS